MCTNETAYGNKKAAFSEILRYAQLRKRELGAAILFSKVGRACSAPARID